MHAAPAYALVIARNNSPLLKAHNLPKELPFHALGFPNRRGLAQSAASIRHLRYQQIH
jgi:hypothetical protein